MGLICAEIELAHSLDAYKTDEVARAWRLPSVLIAAPSANLVEVARLDPFARSTAPEPGGEPEWDVAKGPRR